MRAVIQRVSEARVRVEGQIVGEIGVGFLVLLGVERGDTEADAEYLANKIAGLRVFEDMDGKMNLALTEFNGTALVVSQFTLLGDCRKGRRPGFSNAALPEQALPLYEAFTRLLRECGIVTRTGQFQADMQVELVNDGPVTLLLDSHRQF